MIEDKWVRNQVSFFLYFFHFLVTTGPCYKGDIGKKFYFNCIYFNYLLLTGKYICIVQN